MGATGRWPEVVNLWEITGWDGLAADFEHELVGAGAQDPSLVEWWAAAASLMARLRTPHCTTAVQASGSMATMRLNLAMDIVTPWAWGMAPPDRLVPAPRATTGTPSSIASALRLRLISPTCWTRLARLSVPVSSCR